MTLISPRLSRNLRAVKCSAQQSSVCVQTKLLWISSLLPSDPNFPQILKRGTFYFFHTARAGNCKILSRASLSWREGHASSLEVHCSAAEIMQWENISALVQKGRTCLGTGTTLTCIQLKFEWQPTKTWSVHTQLLKFGFRPQILDIGHFLTYQSIRKRVEHLITVLISPPFQGLIKT